MSFQDQDQPSSDAKSEHRVYLGKIAAPHGVKGLVKILPYGEDPTLIEQVENFKITLKNPIGKYILAEVEGISSREAAEAATGTELYIDKGKLPEIEDENTFYYEDLIGMDCVDETGTDIGTVQAVENYGAGDLLEIRLHRGQDILIPYNDDFVPDIGKKVTLKNYKLFLDH